MYELKINHQACNGLTSCGLCNDHVPGFITEHSGCFQVHTYELSNYDDQIVAAIEDCPTGALMWSEVAPEQPGVEIKKLCQLEKNSINITAKK